MSGRRVRRVRVVNDFIVECGKIGVDIIMHN